MSWNIEWKRHLDVLEYKEQSEFAVRINAERRKNIMKIDREEYIKSLEERIENSKNYLNIYVLINEKR